MSIVEGLLKFLKRINEVISNRKKRTHNMNRNVRTLDIALKNAKVGQKVREFAVTIPIRRSSCPQRRAADLAIKKPG